MRKVPYLDRMKKVIIYFFELFHYFTYLGLEIFQ